ncbi:MAG TPA: glycoside hydrolase family 15 protein [Nevskiaceae bacterium]|nr:glycoside hydrolase family 15 protein [Nevskiaceae bacterium]
MTATLEAWIDRLAPIAARSMLEAVSPVALVKERPGFGQRIGARRGAIVASTVLASWDPDPDYFFHWYRDSAVVVEALRLLHADGRLGDEVLDHVADFVAFNRALASLDGRALTAQRAWRDGVTPKFEQYVRDDADLSQVHGEAVAADTRVNPDGTLDITKWARPQHDGPPLRALALLRWARHARFAPPVAENLAALVRADLDFTLARWDVPSFDIWEEERGRHYYTLRVSAAALVEGAAWCEAQRDRERAEACRATAPAILERLDGYWSDALGHYRSRVLEDGAASTKDLDIAVILAAIHAEDASDRHGVADPRQHATLARLEALFDADYAINRDRPAGTRPAMGRYRGDVYFSGGAYWFSTFGAAEFCFRAAAACRRDAPAWRARGDGYLETARRFVPPGGRLAEQFDRTTGEPSSAKSLAWSYAAFLSAVAARRRVSG